MPMAELTLTETAMRVLRARYLLKDREGRTVETPEGLFRRVARTIALADAFYFEEVRGKPLRHVDASLRHVPPEISERLSRHMLRQLHRAYVRKLRRREVRVSFREFLAILAERWDDVFRVEEEFYDLMTSRRFLPNSPTLMNAGAPLGQLSACFVIPVEDSIEGIMDALALAAKVQKSGGGTGFSFSRLRPEGDIVHSTGGQASGPVSFMKLFDTLTEVIKQGGKRRGANMGVLDVHHPDIEKFITCKADGKSFQNFNISVAASDEFMEAVIHGRKYPLINPRTGEVVKMEDARYIWNLIVQNAWRTGDPGLIFIDRINRMHPARHLGKIEATNPCVSGDTRILTPEGWKTASEIYQEAKMLSEPVAVAVDGGVLGEGGETLAYETTLAIPDGSTKVYETIHGRTLSLDNIKSSRSWVWHVGRKPGLKVVTREGYEITVTHDHKFLTQEGWVEAKELKPGDKIAISRIHPAFFNDIVKGGVKLDPDISFAIGWLVGDGTYNKYYMAWYFGPGDTEARERVEKGLSKLGGNTQRHKRFRKNELTIQFNNTSLVYKRLSRLLGEPFSDQTERRIPEAVWKLDMDSLSAFLRGLFTADGTVDLDKAVRLTSSSLRLLREVQILLTSFGIISRIYERPYERTFEYVTKEGKKVVYRTKGYYELVISGYGRKLFKEFIGFESGEKNDKLSLAKTKIDPIWVTVDHIEDVGLQDFYDFTVPEKHMYIANSFINHNCGEQPLLPYESCNLGSINLSMFIKDEKFDEGVFRATVRQAVHFLDNVIDMNMMPDPRLEEAMLRTRKIGLGVMGFADALVLMGIQYDSGEALEAIDLMGGVLKEEAHAASVDLAGVRGLFPAYRGSLWDELGVPRRNAAVTTIAPTGTISLIAGCSSSIEPYFALVYYRKHAEDVGEWMDAVPLFIEYLHRYGIYSEELLREVAKTGSVQHVPGVPEEIKRLFRTAHDIHYEWHVRIQAQWQKYIEASISKTINLPHDARPDDISRAMLLAYELGAKGVTVYRDRSKDAQVLMKPIDVSKLKVVLTEDKFLVDEDFGGYCRTDGECD